LNIQIVSYTFPPDEGIGGRRWSKMAHYLAEAGHDVSVVCADYGGDTNFFNIRFPGIQVKQLPQCYPSWLSGRSSTLLGKMCYAFTTRILARFGKRNWFDKGLFWKRLLLSHLESVNKEKPIDVLVVSGAPFSTLYYGALFKKAHPGLTYVADFRDPWTWGLGYGMSIITPNQKAEQVRMELEVVQSADMLVCPAEIMVKHLKTVYPQHADKVQLLPHAFDERDFNQVHKISERGDGRIVYGGTLYDGLHPFFEELSAVLVKHPALVFDWHIFSGSSKTYPLSGSVSSVQMVHYHRSVPPTELFCQMAGASWYLVFFPEQYKDFLSTKFYEIFYLGIPVIYVGYDGAVSRFITDHGLGVHILPGEMELKLPALLTEGFKKPVDAKPYDLHRFSFTSVTEVFLKNLEKYKQRSRTV
jgi:glycosyltransferase involved in cell wall biosynthesis